MNSHIPTKPILVLDDDEKYLSFYKEAFDLKKIPAHFAKNGQEGLALLEKNEYSIYIVDLGMSVMSGQVFISLLKEKIKDPIILVQTGFNNPDTIIEVMKLGVFDYIIKPVRLNFIYSVLNKAMEYKFLKDTELEYSKNIQFRLRAQLEWLNYKEERRIKEKSSDSISTLYHLHSSLLQGGGVGTMMSLVDILEFNSEKQGEKVLIDEKIYQLLIDNNNIIRDQINSLLNTVKIFDKILEPEEIKIKALLSKISDSVENIKYILREKRLKVIFPEIHSEDSIKVDLDLMTIAWEELLLNAVKYCKKESKIYILAFVSEGFLNLTFKNMLEPENSIPADMERIIKEPFIRLHPAVENVTKVEKIGFGLGLTSIDYIAQKHGGFFTIHNSIDFTYTKGENCTLAELYIPILQ